MGCECLMNAKSVLLSGGGVGLTAEKRRKRRVSQRGGNGSLLAIWWHVEGRLRAVSRPTSHFDTPCRYCRLLLLGMCTYGMSGVREKDPETCSG